MIVVVTSWVLTDLFQESVRSWSWILWHVWAWDHVRFKSSSWHVRDTWSKDLEIKTLKFQPRPKLSCLWQNNTWSCDNSYARLNKSCWCSKFFKKIILGSPTPRTDQDAFESASKTTQIPQVGLLGTDEVFDMNLVRQAEEEENEVSLDESEPQSVVENLVSGEIKQDAIMLEPVKVRIKFYINIMF